MKLGEKRKKESNNVIYFGSVDIQPGTIKPRLFPFVALTGLDSLSKPNLPHPPNSQNPSINKKQANKDQHLIKLTRFILPAYST